MNVPTTIDAGAWLSKYLEGANGDTDLARSTLGAFAEAIMSPGLDAVQRRLRRAVVGARTRATATAPDPGTRGLARLNSTCPSCAEGSTAPRCCSVRADGPNRRSWR